METIEKHRQEVKDIAKKNRLEYQTKANSLYQDRVESLIKERVNLYYNK